MLDASKEELRNDVNPTAVSKRTDGTLGRDGPPAKLVPRARNIYLSVVLIGLATAVLGGAAFSVHESIQSVARGAAALDATHELIDRLVDAETNERGFLITHDGSFLQPYSDAATAIPPTMGRLRAALSDDPEQLALINRLAPLLDTKLDGLAKAVSLARENRGDEARDMVRGGVETSRGIHAIVGDLLATENRRLGGREDRWRLLGDALLVTALACLAGLLIYLLNQRRALALRDRLQLALDSTGSGAWEWEPASGLSHLDARTRELAGLSSHAVVTADRLAALLHPDDAPAVKAALANALDPAGEGRFLADFRIRRANDGVERWISTRARVSFSDGKPARLVGAAFDISDQKRLEESLRASEERLRRATEAAGLAFSDFDFNSGGIKSSENFARVMGYVAEDTLDDADRRSRERWHADDRARLDRAFAQFKEGVPTGKIDFRLVEPGGRERWIEAMWNTIGDYYGRPARSFVTYLDITERKRAEATIADSEERLRRAGEIAQLSFVDMDLVGGRVTFGENHASVMGYAVSPGSLEEVGARFIERVHPDDRDRIEEHRSRLMRGPWGETIEYRVVTDAGAVRWIEGTAESLADPDGRLTRVIATNFDITARKEAEEALRGGEERLRLALEATESGAWEWDSATDAFVWDTRMNKLLGLAPDDVLTGARLGDLVHADDKANFHASLATATDPSGDARYNVEYRVRRAADGETRWISSRARAYFKADGAHLVGTARDVTDRRLAEESSAYLAAIVRSSSYAIMGLDLDGAIQSWNDGATRLFGYEPDEIIGRSIRELLPADHADEFDSLFGRARAGEEAEMDTARLRKNGTRVDVSVHKAPVRSADGRVIGVSAIVYDITGRKEAEFVKHRLAAIVEQSGEAIIGLSPDGAIETWNPAAQSMFGFRPEEIVGNSFGVLAPRDRDSEQQDIVDRLSRGEIIRNVETTRLHKDGHRLPVMLTAAPLKDESARIVGVSASLIDIRALKEREDDIKRLMAEVNHRSKNMLAVVQAVARQTAGEENPHEFAQRFGARIGGLAAMHDLLVASAWRGVEIADLARSQLTHFHDLIGARIILQGGPARVTPAAAQAIGMALHELATNAARQGALSNDTGGLTIAWGIDADVDEGSRFRMSWREHGGPPAKQPKRPGFAYTVIVRMVAHALDADVELEYGPAGIVWTVDAPAGRTLLPAPRPDV